MCLYLLINMHMFRKCSTRAPPLHHQQIWQDLHIGRVKGIGKMIDDVYHLKSRRSIQHSVATCIATINNDIWHKRLGHVALKIVISFLIWLTNCFFASRDMYFVKNIFSFQSSSSLEIDHYQQMHKIDKCVVDVDLFVVIRNKSIEVPMSLPMPHPLVDSIVQETLTIVIEHVVETSPSAETGRRSIRVVKPPTWLHDFVYKPVKQPTSF
ncbi:hypothetical protein R3W88_012087 [Solanum pinnatisectum]|uniref:Uncharacterized protein n=1 Tax=Solanum pinnatisectum TaxID=50273 RepID=A0AAV9L8D1_9SOLN|nr:hypothetical protein R3W88_012087 [Solanum pinnatisectum]